MDTPILETKRIILRPLRVSDADEVFANWTSDPAVAKYMNWNLHQSVEETLEWLKAEEQDLTNNKNFTWGFVLKETGELFGSGGIRFDECRQMFEPGYNIMKKYWNKGLTTEAVTAILSFAVNELGVKSFFARHAKENPASGEVMKKNGFVYQGEGVCTSYDGKRTLESMEYVLNIL